MGKKVDGLYKSLIQGVSQQAPIDRFDGQHTLQENISNNPERGLVRRPGTEFVRDLDPGAVYYTDFEIDNVKYLLAVHANRLFAYDMAGGSYDVNGSASDIAYLVHSTNLRAVTVDDVVYITNPSVITRMKPDLSPGANTDSGIIFFLGGQYSRVYRITLTWGGQSVSVSYTTPNGSDISHNASTSSEAIATNIYNALIANGTIQSAFAIERKSDVILLTGRAGTSSPDWNISVDDGDGGVTVLAITSRTGDIGKLPRFAPHNYTVRVVGSEGTEDDDWFLRFDQDGSPSNSLDSGIWVESVQPGITYKIDPETMPRKLTFDGTAFTLSVADWMDRRAGNENTNPDPSFIGKGIEDITLFQSRLVLLAGSNVILSRTSEYTDFWKNSATTLADDDVIDVSSSTTVSAPIMRKAVPHNRDLVIFAESAQFIVFGRNAITPHNTSLVLTTTYEVNTRAIPVSSGKNIFYSNDFGKWSGMNEFFVESGADINAARSITDHCSKYIQGTVTLMQCSTNFNMLLTRTSDSANIIYVYQYLWLGNDKAQSAWSKWIFPEPIVHFFFYKDRLYFVSSSSMEDRITLQVMRMDTPEDIAGYHVHLDNKTKYRYVQNAVEISDDIGYFSMHGYIVVQGNGCPEPGMAAPVDWNKSTKDTVYFQYSMNGGEIIVGTPFMSRTILSRPVIRDSQENSITTGRLSVHHFIVELMDSGHIRGTRLSKTDPEMFVDYSGRFIRHLDNVIGEEFIGDYIATVPFMGDVACTDLELSTDEATPFRIVQVSYVGDYAKQGSHI